MTQNPIFFGVTRSFWATVATIALLLEQGEPMARAIATLGATVFGWDADAVTQWIMSVGPLVTFLFAMHQRDGARPWTMRPDAVTIR